MKIARFGFDRLPASGFGNVLWLRLPVTFLGILTIAGCIYVPVSERPLLKDGRNVNDVIGAQSTDKPIRQGITSRELVIKMLGTPYRRTVHDLVFEYRASAVAGHYYGLSVNGDDDGMRRPLGAPKTNRVEYDLLLEFDRQGLLQRYNVNKVSNGDAEWHALIKSVGDEEQTGE